MNRLFRRALVGFVAPLAITTIVIPTMAPAFAQAQAPAPSATPKPPAITLAMGDSRLGRVMVDGEGLTLYMFAVDGRNVSNCEGQCLTFWPPLLLPKGGSLADVRVGANLRRLELGVAMRADGTAQVTYRGWPLYYWALDARPGDVRGQWVTNNWWVLNEDGVPNLTR